VGSFPRDVFNDPTFLLFTSTDPSMVSNFNYKSLAFLYIIIPSRVMRGIEIEIAWENSLPKNYIFLMELIFSMEIKCLFLFFFNRREL